MIIISHECILNASDDAQNYTSEAGKPTETEFATTPGINQASNDREARAHKPASSEKKIPASKGSSNKRNKHLL